MDLIGIDIEKVIFQLKSHTDIHAKLIQLLRIFHADKCQPAVVLVHADLEDRADLIGHLPRGGAERGRTACGVEDGDDIADPDADGATLGSVVGTVSASGDLAPLSHIAAVVIGGTSAEFALKTAGIKVD